MRSLVRAHVVEQGGVGAVGTLDLSPRMDAFIPLFFVFVWASTLLCDLPLCFITIQPRLMSGRVIEGSRRPDGSIRKAVKVLQRLPE